MTDLWTEASRDVEAENAFRRTSSAKLSVTSFWPFLAAAESEADFENRLALVGERIETAVPDDALRAETVASLREDYRLMVASRPQTAVEASKKVTCGACNGKQPAKASCGTCGGKGYFLVNDTKPQLAMKMAGKVTCGACNNKAPAKASCGTCGGKGYFIANDSKPQLASKNDTAEPPPFSDEGQEGGEKTSGFVARVKAAFVALKGPETGASLPKLAEFPWQKADADATSDDKKKEEEGAEAPAEGEAPPVVEGEAPAGEGLEAAQAGQAVTLHYKLADGTEGDTPATVQINDGTTATFTYDKGTFKVTNANGVWTDPIGTVFTMGAAAPAAPAGAGPAPQPGAAPAGSPPAAEKPDEEKKENPFEKKKSTVAANPFTTNWPADKPMPPICPRCKNFVTNMYEQVGGQWTETAIRSTCQNCGADVSSVTGKTVEGAGARNPLGKDVCQRCGSQLTEDQKAGSTHGLCSRCFELQEQTRKRQQPKESAKANPYGSCPKCGSGRYRKDLKVCVQCGYKAEKKTAYMGDPYWMTARRPGWCAKCDEPFAAGDEVFYFPSNKSTYSGACADQASRQFASESADEGGFSDYASKTAADAPSCPECGTKMVLPLGGAQHYRCPGCGHLEPKGAEHSASKTANEYLPSGNPYSTEPNPGQAAPPPDPTGVGGTPLTTKPRQMPAGAPPAPGGPMDPNALGQPPAGLPEENPPVQQPSVAAALNTSIPVRCEGCGSRSLAKLSTLAAGMVCACGCEDYDLDDDLDQYSLGSVQTDDDRALAFVASVAPDFLERVTAGVKESDLEDFNTGGSGVIAMIRALITGLLRGDKYIPKWFPKSYLTDEEKLTGRWSTSFGSSGDWTHAFGAKEAEWSQNNTAPATETNAVKENFRCASCLIEFTGIATDPAQPIPPCPNCGSVATSAAGAVQSPTRAVGSSPHRCTATDDGGARCSKAADHISGHSFPKTGKIEAITAGILSTNPGMTRESALRLATETVRRYPKVALGLDDQPKRCTICQTVLADDHWTAESTGMMARACSPEHAEEAANWVAQSEHQDRKNITIYPPGELAVAAHRQANKKLVTAR